MPDRPDVTPQHPSAPESEPAARIAALETQLAEGRARIAALQAAGAAQGRLELIEREIATVHGRLAEVSRTDDAVRALKRELKLQRRTLRKLEKQPLVRAAIRATQLRWAVERRARRAAAIVLRRRGGPKPGARQAALAEAIRAARPGPFPAEGPLVSIIVLTRDGAEHLRRLFAGLRSRTTYRNFEVIVVDNGSGDETAGLLSREHGFPLRVIRNEHNTTFSQGNNQGVAQARGDLVLLLNNDVEPVNAGWLGAMVQTLLAAEARAAVGALLVYPERPGRGRRSAQMDLRVQHRGIGFTFESGAPRARNLGGGEDPLTRQAAEVRAVPGVTAACMLVRKDALLRAGGLTEGYVYGTEDVDLCLKLGTAGGEIWFCGQAALFHHEFGTQDRLADEEKARNRARNWTLFAETWGPALSRSLRLDKITGAGRWTGRTTRTAAITVTRDDPAAGWGDWYTAHELGEALERSGWRVVYVEAHLDRWYKLEDEVDLCIVLLDRFDVRRAPRGAFTVAWIRNWTDRWTSRPWFHLFDLVLSSSGPSVDIVRRSSHHHAALFPLASNVHRFSPGEPSPELACDFTFTGNNWEGARGSIASLQVREGERFALYGHGWEEEPAVVAHRRGFLPYERLPALYRSAKVVIDNAAPHTLPYGSLNSRVFDALACGALVVTDNVLGSQELFDGLLPTYSTPEELREVLDTYLGDDELRQKTVESLRRIVVERHSYDHRADELVRAATEEIERPRIRIRNPASNAAVAESWGDTHFARAFARALRERGYSTRIDLRADWDDPATQDADVVLAIRGLHAYAPKPGALNALWIISHPDDISADECEPYAQVFAASATFAERLATLLGREVGVLHQATDIELFVPGPPAEDLRARLLFVGNARTTPRPAIQWAVELQAPLTVYGKRWNDLLPTGVVRNEYFPNERLAELYRSADIVLSDHWGDMATEGFVSNRVFDALASGAFVISDEVQGIDELFEGAVPTFKDKEGLAGLLERFLNDENERQRRARAGMDIVRARHSFDARAEHFTAQIAPRLAARPRTLEEMIANAGATP